MEHRRASLDPEILFCSICLDQLKDPVTVPCGHSYCLSCINGFWDGEDQKKIYSCPQCRQEFTARPVLKKSTMLAALVEQLKKTGLQAAAAAAAAGPCYAAAGDVSCDVCTGRKLKALKSCLVCLASYCENHLQFHHESPKFKKHQLVEPSEKLQENICSQHDEVMKMFCRSDHQIICYLCSVDQHKGHDTVSAAAERSERQKELEGSRQKIQQRIQDREEDLKLLQQQLEDLSCSADKAVEDSEEIFTQLIRLLQKRSCELKQQIRSQQQTEVSGLQDVEEKLQQEIRELKRKDAELKLLSHTEDHNKFLHNYPRTQLSRGTSSIQIPPLRRFEDVTAAVSELRDQLQDLLKDTWTNISLAATGPKTRAEGQLQDVLKDTWTNISLAATGPKTRAEGQLQDVLKDTWTNISLAATGPKTRAEGQLQDVLKDTWTNIDLAATEPKTRAEFLKYSCEITMDPNTAHRWLLLSDGNRKATNTCPHPQPYSSHPDRFTGCSQVLSRQSLTGRCYWEVEMRRRGVGVAVTYKNISRTRRESVFGFNNKSWALDCFTNSYRFDFNNIQTSVSGPVSSRLGVFLDHRAGLLSFYSVSETMTLLHRVQTTFTQPLYAGLAVYLGSTAEFCEVK